ncbi:MAG TPA: ATP-grasp domain-containing protein, partial [Acidimicrobiales bacterium]|nr:ATP-grasp domain-containing protein [Acidimicrobiales bacterium]
LASTSRRTSAPPIASPTRPLFLLPQPGPAPMRVVVTFDTPYDGWEHPDHERQMATEVAAWKHDEPEMEYQIADALRVRGHEVMLVGVRNDLQYLVRCLEEIRPDLVFNAVEAFHGNAGLEYMVPGILEAEGWRYTGSPPLALLVSRNKAMSKKVLAYHGIRVPGFLTCRPGEPMAAPSTLRFPLIVKPLQSDASAGIAQASVVQDQAALADRVTMIHERFDQPAIAEEFIDGRELYVSLIGNGGDLDLLPITEMVFDKRRTRVEERIATQFAKWDEDYRARKGIRNVFARPLARATRARLEEICRTAFRALWLRDYARLDVRLAPDGEIWVLEANANPFISYGHDMANAAEKAGMDYYQFIQRLVDEAMARHGHA